MIAAQDSAIANKILTETGSQLEELLEWDKPSKIKSTTEATRWAQFWLNIANDQKVKVRLQDMNLPIKLYQLIREKGDENSEQIIQKFDNDYLVLIVELILKISAGHSQLEEQLTKTVIEDLTTLRKKRDMFFINKVLLPLIKNEMTIPVCIMDRTLSSEWQVNADSLSVSQTTKDKQS